MQTHNFNRILLSLYFLSGVVSIAFEILWSRYFGLLFGASNFGVVVTVAAFMAGLGAGALLAVTSSGRVRRPLLVFFFMELLVAIFALAMPVLFRRVDGLLQQLTPTLQGSDWLLLQGGVTLVILFLPACAMGYGFPFVLKAVRRDAAVVGKLYGLNALGGVTGAVLPLLLLPQLGWFMANSVIAVTGLLIATAALIMTRSHLAAGTAAYWRGESALPAASLLLYGIIGAAALILEISWTRLFGMVMLRTEYVLAIILASFLAGVGLGSLLAPRLRAPAWFTVLPLLAGLCAVASLWAFTPFSAWVERTAFSSLLEALLLQGGLLFVMVLPVTLVLGAWFPLLTTRLGHNKRGAAVLYGFNSIGAAIGVLMTGLVLIPRFGTNTTLITGVALLSVAGLWLAGDDLAGRLKRLPLVLLPLALALPVTRMPEAHALLPLALDGTRDLTVHEDALSITHVVEEADGQRLLLADLQRMDASSQPEAVVLQQNQARLGLLLGPEAGQVLFLGMGTGITAATVGWLPQIRATAVELSEGAILAARQQFAAVHGGRLGTLRVVRDDVRHFLTVDEARYELIFGDLFHPDLVGRGLLLTEQHFARVRSRLADTGVYIQWLSLNQFDLPSLQSVLKAFANVFADNALFLDGFRLALVGGAPLDIGDAFRRYQALSPELRRNLDGGEGFWTWAGRYIGRIPALAEVAPQDQWAPVIEYRLPRARFEGGLDVASLTGWLLGLGHDRRTAERLRLPPREQFRFQAAHSATRIAHQAWIHILNRRDREGLPMMRQAFKANPRDRWISAALADSLWDEYSDLLRRKQDIEKALGRTESQLLAAVLKLSPDHPGALKRHWQLALAAGDQARARHWRERFAKVAPLDKDLARHNITH